MERRELQSQHNSSFAIYIFAAFLMVIFALSFCSLPNFIMLGEFSRFDAPTLSSLIKSYLTNATITLDDDNMIALRAGYMIHATGLPQYNINDLAQPSTSYLTPYLFYLLDGIFPRTNSPFIYGIIILASAISSLLLLYKTARIKANAVIIMTAFLLTTTFINQAFRGWDHFIQGFFICAALTWLLPRSPITVIFSAILNVGTVAARPDALLLSLAILTVFIVQNRSRHRYVITYVITYLAGLAFLFGYNELNFGYIFPTTVRLKALSGNDLALKFKYIYQNLLFHFTAEHIWIALFLLIVTNPRRYLDFCTTALVLASCATVIIANINGDVFYGYRMMWTPALVLAYVVVQKNEYRFLHTTPDTFGIVGSKTIWLNSRLAWTIISIVMVLVSRGFIEKNVRASLNVDYRDSEMSRQFVMAHWINTHLQPEKGAIGLFYAGTAYHLPQFRIADLLGKADEAIASTAPKWGSPGHNKWNFDLSLSKWNPQAIFIEANIEPSSSNIIEAAKQSMLTRMDGSYVYEAFLNEKIRTQYQYCYLLGPDIESRSPALFLRNDVADDLKVTHQERLACIALPPLE